MSGRAAFACATLLFTSLVVAEPDAAAGADPVAPTPTPAAEEATPFEEPEDDIPQAPSFGDEEEAPPPPPARAVLGYPGREVDRPVSLPGGVGEIALSIKATSLPEAGGLLRLRYGITPRVQFGLLYGGVSAYDKPTNGGGSSFSVEPGKSIGAELQVVIVDGVAVRATVPMYLDPYAAGVSIGAPIHVRLNSRFALVGLEDVVSFRVHKFFPSLLSEGTNIALAAAQANNGVVPRGTIRIVPGLMYQQSDKLSVGGQFGLLLINFGDDPTGVELKGRMLYNISTRFDFWATAGFDNLDDASDNISAQLGLALRL
ncbi:MAG: hypothetical protein IPL79_04760 [Myxococcales bacterium]|nr:hypothetical protein [Myxococcales bacterium]